MTDRAHAVLYSTDAELTRRLSVYSSDLVDLLPKCIFN